MFHTTVLARYAVATVAATLLMVTSALPVAAGPDPGQPVSRSDAEQKQCLLRRIDRQLVRCDFLTGAGVAAPVAVPHI